MSVHDHDLDDFDSQGPDDHDLIDSRQRPDTEADQDGSAEVEQADHRGPTRVLGFPVGAILLIVAALVLVAVVVAA